MSANRSTFLHIATTLAFLLLLFGPSQPALAQSNVTLQLHAIKAQPIQGSASYDVSVNFSLFDSAGNPIKNAAMGDFTVTEDNQPVKIASLGAVNEPINVAVLLDTSGSMAGDKINAARSAATRFIEDLQSNDQAAVLTFDKTTTNRIDFTLDHSAAKQQVALVDATPGGYSCLYDAAYETIQLANALPSGQRAVILLTDGKDEASNGTLCSLHTIDDVIRESNAGQTQTPIYTIGLGEQVDTQTLQSLANGTRGRYQFSPGPSQLEALFGRLLDELRSQYSLHYSSRSEAGEHSLTLHVKYQSAEDEVSGRMEMQTLPYSLSFIFPADAAEISDVTMLSVDVSGQGAPIQKIEFLANNVPIGFASTPPYHLEWNPSGINKGTVVLEAVAQDATGGVLASSSITVSYKPVVVQPTLAPTPTSSSQGGKLSITSIYLAAAAGLLLVGIVVTLLLTVGRRRRQEKVPAAELQEKVQAPIAAPAASKIDRTMDSFFADGNALGTLIILQSDDPAMLNQRIEIVNPTTHLGRKADNEVIFAKDSPVSRHHAIIEACNGQLLLSEVVAADEQTGQPKRPVYGTFVNGLQVQEPVMLKDGDEILLGKRVRIHFVAATVATASDERTLDQIVVNPEDKTMAAFADGKTESPGPEEKTVIPAAGDVVEAPASDEKTVIPTAGDGSVTPGPDDKTVIASPCDNEKNPGPEDKTVLAFAGEKAKAQSDVDKTIIPGARPR